MNRTLLILLSFIFNVNIEAQNSGSTYVTANVIIPAEVRENSDFFFSNNDTHTTASRVITFPSVCIPYQASNRNVPLAPIKIKTFTSLIVTGQPEHLLTVSLPGCTDLINENKLKMAINTFSVYPSKVCQVSKDGMRKLYIGANLIIPATQATGVYTNFKDVSITINYN